MNKYKRKTKQVRELESAGERWVSIFYWVVVEEECPVGKLTFEQNSLGREGVSYVDILRRVFQAERTSTKDLRQDCA